jgi:hypothetical protein
MVQYHLAHGAAGEENRLGQDLRFAVEWRMRIKNRPSGYGLLTPAWREWRSHRRRFVMAAYAADGTMLLIKKFGGMVLIFFGILGIAIGLEYRSNGLSVGLIVAGIVALACGMGLLALKIVRRNAGSSGVN